MAGPKIVLSITSPSVTHALITMTGRDTCEVGVVPIGREVGAAYSVVGYVAREERFELSEGSYKVHVAGYDYRCIGFKARASSGLFCVSDECHNYINFLLARRIT